MSKRKERIAVRDRQDFKKFITVVGIIVVIVIVITAIIMNVKA